MGRPTAVGIHVFAGGFTQGVRRVFDVRTHLEVHGFGLETAEALCGVECLNHSSADWPEFTGQLAFGNPRCTAFSAMTGGPRWGDSDIHGAFAKQTCDIEQFCAYAAGRFDIAVWESVQGAYKIGRPLLDHVRREYYAPRGYRIAHVLLNAASFGNAQQRKRYFHVAYRDDRTFNVEPPVLADYQTLTYDVLKESWDAECHPMTSSSEYDEHSYERNVSADEWEALPRLPNGWGCNTLAEFAYDRLPERWKDVWDTRCSDMPFSMHCLFRLNPRRPFPTIHSSSGRLVHPEHHRPVTIGEVARAMGWEGIPRGRVPVQQIGKGIVPAVGEWLAKQVLLYLDGAWGRDDWESSYDAQTGTWVGRDTTGEPEKTFDLTKYHPRLERDYDGVPFQYHRLNVDRRGKPHPRGSAR